MLAVLENALEQYNESNAVMDLVLFEDAMKHIARISRADAAQKMNLNLIWWRRYRLDAVDAAARAPSRLVRKPRPCRDGAVPTQGSRRRASCFC